MISSTCESLFWMFSEKVLLQKGLLENTTDIRQLLFPAEDQPIDLGELTKLVNYEVADDSNTVLAKQHLEKYFNLLSETGKTITHINGINY